MFSRFAAYIRYDAVSIDLYTEINMKKHTSVRPTRTYKRIVESRNIETIDIVDSSAFRSLIRTFELRS